MLKKQTDRLGWWLLTIPVDWAFVLVLLGSVLVAAAAITGFVVWVRLLGDHLR